LLFSGSIQPKLVLREKQKQASSDNRKGKINHQSGLLAREGGCDSTLIPISTPRFDFSCSTG
jgi:hypothetical protein